eukprot:scaffold216957_cov27-Tisochrysis_lutea.AAC.2
MGTSGCGRPSKGAASCGSLPESEETSSADNCVPAGSTPFPFGSSSKACALAHDRRRLEIWRPVDVATRPSGVAVSVARWYSGRSGSSLSASPLTTETRRGNGMGRPSIRRSAGAMTREKQTSALTGLPGRPNTRRGGREASGSPPAPMRDTVAKVSGLPGFIRTRSNSSVPRRSSVSPRKSRAPIETPPELMRMSHSWASALSRAQLSSWRPSATIPRSSGMAPSASTAASNAARFES